MKADCKEIEKHIPAFLDDALTNAELKQFLEHVETCESCKEELTIQFLMQVGTKRLEDGKAFHLGESLKLCLKDAHTRLNRRVRLERLSGVMQFSVVAGIVLLAALMILLL